MAPVVHDLLDVGGVEADGVEAVTAHVTHTLHRWTCELGHDTWARTRPRTLRPLRQRQTMPRPHPPRQPRRPVTFRFPPPERLLHRLDDDHTAVAKVMPLLAALSGYAANHHSDHDGYPTGGSQTGSRGSDDTSSTQRAAEARLALGAPTDAELEAIIEGALAGYTQLLLAASRLSAYIAPRTVSGRTIPPCPICLQPRTPKTKPGATVERCLICEREIGEGTTSRNRAGFCDTDHKQWTREHRPDRAWFIKRRRKELAAAREVEQAKTAKAGVKA